MRVDTPIITKTPMIKPTGFRLLVELHAKPDRTKAGILLPETITDNRPLKGTILARGPLAEDLEVGDQCLFDKDTGIDLEQDGKLCRLIDSRGLIAKVETA